MCLLQAIEIVNFFGKIWNYYDFWRKSEKYKTQNKIKKFEHFTMCILWCRTSWCKLYFHFIIKLENKNDYGNRFAIQLAIEYSIWNRN